MPVAAPAAAASITLAGLSAPSLSSASNWSIGVSVSGLRILANKRPPGAAMNDAAIRYSRGTPIEA